MSLLAGLKYNELFDRNLDDPSVTAFHRQVIRTKPFLRRLYEFYYADFVANERALSHLKGKTIELGSGGGFLKDLIPSIVTTDVTPYQWVDRVESAYGLSFGNGEIKAIYMSGVLHHLGDVRRFFAEAIRCLEPGGRIVLMEPHMSWFGRIFFQKLHHEPNDCNARAWEFPQTGPLSDANTALPSLIFDRDFGQFQKEFPQLRVVSRKYHTFLMYGLSGGVSFKFSAPGWSFPLLNGFEVACRPLMRRFLATMQTIVIERI